MDEGTFGLQIDTPLEFDAAEAAIRAALATEGFGILTEIDVQATLAEKLGVKMEPYKILGACNPKYAHEALQIWRGFGLLMPCNVIVEELGSHRVVRAFDPLSISEVRDVPALLPIARQVHDAMERALSQLPQD